MAPGLSRKGSPMSAQTLYSRAFLAATLERAIRSFAASLASLLSASGAGIIETDWGEKFSVAGVAAVVTILFAIAGGTLGKGDAPSFNGGEQLPPERPAPVAAQPVEPVEPQPSA